ncbi:Copine-like protein, partial [Globisporangium splendens]
MGNSSSSSSKHRRHSSVSQRQRAATMTTQSGPRPVGRGSTHAEMIPDQFASIEQVTSALRRNGLESCNLIVGIDFTKSNEWSGKRTFGGRSLHSTDDPYVLNPYENVIETIGKTLRDFDEDNVIPVFGFGDEMTGDHSVFTLSPDQMAKPGFALEEIRKRYRDVVPNVVMAGPTSFAPIINEAVSIVNRTGGYHILVIIADGQVTRSVDIPAHACLATLDHASDECVLFWFVFVYDSNFPLSIIMVGVGDGPWDSMIYFDNYLTHRKFDNFQFVEFHVSAFSILILLQQVSDSCMDTLNVFLNVQKITSQYGSAQQRETQFALHALMEVPVQYQIIKQLGYLSRDNFSRGAYMYAQDMPSVVVYPCPLPMQPTYATQYGVYQPVTNHDLFAAATTVDTQPPPSYQTAAASAPSAPSGPDEGYGSDASVHAFESAVPAAAAVVPPAAQRPSLQHRASAAELELNRLQEELLCAICEDRRKDTVFQCGHETCKSCADTLTHCPICRAQIQVRIKRFA